MMHTRSTITVKVLKLSAMRKGRLIHRFCKSWQLKLLLLWVLVAAIIARCIYQYMEADLMAKRREVLVSMCDERAKMLQDRFAVSVNHVHALAILVSTFYHQKNPRALDQETFAEYSARTAFERPLLIAVAYAEKVGHLEGETFERRLAWTIKKMNGEPSSPHEEYSPVISSQSTVSYLDYVDMISGEDPRNIWRDRASTKAVLSRPFRMPESNHLGVVLTFPVYSASIPPYISDEEGIRTTTGYLGGAFDVEALVKNLLMQLAGTHAIIVNVYDVTNISLPLIMYGPVDSEGDMSLLHISMLDFGDPYRKHQMTCRYGHRAPIPWSAVIPAVGFFVIAVLVGHIFYAAVAHICKIEEGYHEMEELKVQAEAADIAKSQFLATVSHEIRTPMNGVLGMLAMLLDTNLGSNQKNYAETAQACGKALITLINQVLDRAKIEAGKLELEAVPFDLRCVLDDVISLFSSKSREKGIELAVFVSGRVPEILIGDPGRLRQIITNVVDNSVKFTEAGHILVHVCLVDPARSVVDSMNGADVLKESEMDDVHSSSVDSLSGFMAVDGRNYWETFKLLSEEECPDSIRETSDSVTLLVTVEDTGIGIPLHAQDRVFTPFMQADSSTSRNYGGTGIGLSITKCLVEMMGGKISFISCPNIGSTFTFTVVTKNFQSNATGNLKQLPLEALPTNFRGMKAVVVDNRLVRGAVTKYHLKRLGILVEVADNVETVFDLLSQQEGCLKPR